ncbi:hypothetical protein HRS9122_04299 [Pyrenophora teres f. teres]|nr:hypothetical protein HRS9122_04299 [Pyrenophora teres f. teres]
MEFNWNTDGHPATFDHSDSASSVCPSKVGDLIGYEMAHTELAPWTLEELGYTYDAPHVCPNGRMNNQSHSPDYYAYSSPCEDSWQGGLQEIERFDWYTEKDVEKHIGKGEDENLSATKRIDSPDGIVAVIPSHSEGTELYVQEDSSLLDKKNDAQIQASSAVADALFKNTATTDASCTPSPSPPWICSIVHRNFSTHTTTHLEDDSDGESGVKKDGDCNSDASYDVVTDDISIVSEFENLAILPGDAHNAISTYKNSSGGQVPQGGDSNAQDVARALVGDMDEEGSHTADHSAPITVETLKDVCPTAVTSQVPSENSVIPTHSQTKTAQVEDQCQVQDEELEQGSPMTGDAHLEDTSPALPQSRSGSSPIEETLQAKLEVTVHVEPELSPSPTKETTSPQLPENVAHADIQANEPWQAQLQDAADNTSAEDLSIRNSPAHCEHSVEQDQAYAVETKDTHVDASSAPASTPLEQHIHSDTVLPPSPFQPKFHGTGHVYTKEVPVEVNQDEGKTLAAPFDDTGTMEAVPPKSPTSPEKSKTTNPRKLSKRARKARSVSESDSDAPLKKKSKTLAPANGVPACTENSGESPEEEKGREKLRAKTRMNGENLVKEVAQLDESIEKQTRSKQGNNARNLSIFAYGPYTKPSPPATPTPLTEPSEKTTFDSETDFKQQDECPNSSMKEHYSDVEIPVPLDTQTPTQVPSLDTPRTRSVVSQRELSSLSETKYRMRSSTSQRKPLPTARQLFAKPDTSSTVVSSTKKTLDESLSVPCVGENTDMIVEDNVDEEVTTPTVSKSKTKTPAAKDTTGKSVKAKVQQMPKKTPATRNLRKRKASPVEQGVEQEENREPILFPAPKLKLASPKTEVKSAVPQPIQPSMRRSVRRKTQAKRQEELVPGTLDPQAEAEENASDDLSPVPSTLVSPVKASFDQNSHEDYEKELKDDGEDHGEDEDAYGEFDEEDEDEEEEGEQDSDYMSTPYPKSKANPKENTKPTPRSKKPPKPAPQTKAIAKPEAEPKAKAKSKAPQPSRSTKKNTTAPTPQRVPCTPFVPPTAVANKYGFSSRKTRQSVKKTKGKKVDYAEVDEDEDVEADEGEEDGDENVEQDVDVEVKKGKAKGKAKAKGRKR